ncbi:TMV resistance protein N-like, partial [Daucus carota subsp. sativus]|uniref:TMV resistance protein N-like n=1 Tax=Daucus carota subsp. sativus TaxID=79200 RepID=UPI00308271F5
VNYQHSQRSRLLFLSSPPVDHSILNSQANRGSSQTPASSSAPNSALIWDVFLSYRGPDTGPTFTAHLYKALNDHRIKTFKDDYKLRQGEVLPKALRTAIKESKIYIVVFSEDYASSTWCLDELVDIVSLHEKEERLIIPVFHHIDPSTVRHVSIDKEEEESSIYDKALQLHAKGYYKNEEQRVKSWLHALNVPAGISGSHVCEKNREEPDVIEKIVAEILPRTKPKSFNEKTVGLDGSIKSIEELVSSGATKIGIYGMGGVGKTTLAKAVFDMIHLDFKGSCFLADVTENSSTNEGMKCLQQQLLNDVLLQNEKDVNDVADGKKLIETRLKDQKILVVIDDLNHSNPLKFLGVKSFGHGSVVIITTRQEDILKYFEIYGSVVHTKYEVEEWREFIEDLKETINEEIQDRLVISYDAIDGTQLKKMFLDIACFFIGWQKERVFEILETYYPYVNVKINNLKGRCLLTIDDKNVLHMHDLLRDMGRKVAQNKSPGNPAKYSRLWRGRDIERVLTEENECVDMDALEGIYYKEELAWELERESEEPQLKTFKKMKNLRFLHLVGFRKPIGSFDKTFRDLRWLSWEWCPLEHFPLDFKPINLGILELTNTSLRTMELNMVFQKLKILKVTYSWDLTTTPDFNMLPSLVSLSFLACPSLTQIHRSIGRLAGLVSLNLGACWMLASLPETIGNLKALKHLDLQECTFTALPLGISRLTNLECLKLEGCSQLLSIEELPPNLKKLYASRCPNLKQLDILNLTRFSGLEVIVD